MKNLKNYIVESSKEDDVLDIKLWDGGYEKEDLEGYKVIEWPQSQVIFDKKGAEDNAWLINDEEGFEKYGSAAYVVDKNWWEGKEDEDSEEDSEDEDEKDKRNN